MIIVMEYSEALRQLGKSEATIASYEHDLISFHAWLKHDGIKGYPETKDQARAFFRYLRMAKKSPQACNHTKSALKSFYNYLMDEKQVTTNPFLQIQQMKTAKRLPVFLSKDEAKLFVESENGIDPSSLRNRALFELAYGCGLRASELLNLKISNLDLNEGYLKAFGKGSKERLVPMGQEAIKAVEAWLESGRPKFTVPESDDWLFLNTRGNPLSRNGLWDIVKNKSKAVLGKAIGPHVLRHSFASHLLEGGANIREVQELLGHASITTTQIYTHIDQSQLRKSFDQHHPRA